jgi:ABC-2 type transport system permease protein
VSGFVATTTSLSMRHVRTTLRIPVFVALTLFQPIIWLLLYGQLFQKAVQIPNFHASSYTAFLAPGVVVMTALFSGIWSGMSTVGDLQRGIIDRYLTTPASRLGIVVSRVLSLAAQIVAQAAIILLLAVLVGAHLYNGIVGPLVVLFVAALVSATFGSLSFGLAMLTRREETMIGVGNFLSLPLTFLSAIFIARNLMPAWMQHISDANPLEWAATAARTAITVHTSWSIILSRCGLLAATAAAATWFAVWTFSRYQRTL